MHRLMLHNGAILDTAAPCLSPGQIGLLNGWGVFTTIRVYDGVMFAWERHWKRMQADSVRMHVPFPVESGELERQLNQLVEANKAWNATLRVAVVKNRGGMFEGPAPMRDYDVIAFTRDVYAWAPNMKLGLVPNGRHAASEFAGTKYISWAENLTRYERAHDQGLDEVVLLNERGEVSECTSANIFVAKGSDVWTPPLDSGCLAGVTRAVLLEEVQAQGLRISERTLQPADLESADEVFLTSTTRELLPVISVEGLRLQQGEGAVCRALQKGFTAAVEGYLAPRRKTVPI